MTYSRKKEKITIEFTIEEYGHLLAILGFALTAGSTSVVGQDVSIFIKDLHTDPEDYYLIKETFFGKEFSDKKGAANEDHQH